MTDIPTVLVVGGGTAGVAAVAGVRASGARPVLVERQGFLGGMATGALVGTLCGLYLRTPDTGPRWAVGGFARRFAERLRARGGHDPLSWKEGLWFLPYDPFDVRVLCDAEVEAAGAEVHLHTTIHGVTVDGGDITEVRGLTWDRPWSCRPDAVVDASGTGVVSRLAGAALLDEEPRQAASFVWSMAPVDDVPSFALQLAILKALRSASDAGDLEDPDATAVSLVPGGHRDGRVVLKLGLRRRLSGVPEEVTAEERRARATVAAVARVLVAAVPALSGARVVDAAAQVGVRTGPRPVGRSVLTADRLHGSVVADDDVAAGCWPIEDWGEDVRPRLDPLPAGRVYGIPAGALRSRDLDALWFAGRGLSATEEAAASARVIGTCLSTGYAAGRLAAVSARGDGDDDAVGRLHAEQVRAGITGEVVGRNEGGEEAS